MYNYTCIPPQTPKPAQPSPPMKVQNSAPAFREVHNFPQTPGSLLPLSTQTDNRTFLNYALILGFSVLMFWSFCESLSLARELRR